MSEFYMPTYHPPLPPDPPTTHEAKCANYAGCRVDMADVGHGYNECGNWIVHDEDCWPSLCVERYAQDREHYDGTPATEDPPTKREVPK